MKTIYPITLFLVMLTASILLVNPIKHLRGKYIDESYTRIGALPSSLLRGVCLEFNGVAADILFLKTMTFMGHNIGQNTNPDPDDWQAIYRTLDKITDLDPAFWDPYVFAEMILVWQKGMITEVDQLLKKAAISRPDDYRPLYYLGFNAFYFRHRASEAAPYLREAAKRRGAPSYIQGLASRMSLYGSQTVMGIIFLEELIPETYDPINKKELETRLDALKKIYSLERAVQKYRKDKGIFPPKLKDLVDEKYIEQIPTDPYGGEFVLLTSGKVYTTSNLLPQHKKQ